MQMICSFVLAYTNFRFAHKVAKTMLFVAEKFVKLHKIVESHNLYVSLCLSKNKKNIIFFSTENHCNFLKIVEAVKITVYCIDMLAY